MSMKLVKVRGTGCRSGGGHMDLQHFECTAIAVELGLRLPALQAPDFQHSKRVHFLALELPILQHNSYSS